MSSPSSHWSTDISPIAIAILLAFMLYGSWTRVQEWQLLSGEARQGVVTHHERVEALMYAQIQLEPSATAPASKAQLVEPGLRHEPGQVLTDLRLTTSGVYEHDPWRLPWLLWFAAQTLVLMVLLVARLRGNSKLTAGSMSSSFALLALLLWVHAGQWIADHTHMLRKGEAAEATVIAAERRMSSGRGRRNFSNVPIVHFLAAQSLPPRFVQVLTEKDDPNLIPGRQVDLLYLPEQPTRILLTGSRWMAWLTPALSSFFALLLSLAALLLFKSRQTVNRGRS